MHGNHFCMKTKGFTFAFYFLLFSFCYCTFSVNNLKYRKKKRKYPIGSYVHASLSRQELIERNSRLNLADRPVSTSAPSHQARLRLNKHSDVIATFASHDILARDGTSVRTGILIAERFINCRVILHPGDMHRDRREIVDAFDRFHRIASRIGTRTSGDYFFFQPFNTFHGVCR